ncbi:MAG: HlyD family secretion protein [Solirubrobacterales bacterium]|nr:HlyD family secretion protein [Solirubrobacterales bacterium]
MSQDITRSTPQTELPATVSLDGAPHPASAVAAPVPVVKRRSWRRWALVLAGLLVVAVIGAYVVPSALLAFRTVSTDDAYVNGHVTFVAPRVAGKVIEVLVDDNNPVKKGDVLVRIDPETFQVQVNLKRAAVEVAKGDLAAAESQARGLEALARSQRWKTESASEQVNNQIALLKSRVATLQTKEAVLERARADFERGRETVAKAAISREEFDQRRQDLRVAEASVNQAREEVYQVRASLGLPLQPEKGKPLTDVPPDIDQTFSEVRTAVAQLLQIQAQLGLPLGSTNLTPRQALEEFKKLDAQGDIDRITRDLVPRVPAVIQARAKLAQARHDLEQAELDLSYCEVHSDIDGVVTRRNVNPGNFLQVGQQLMAVRSVREIWIDANFKETQLADLRIGQRVVCEVDMYGGRRDYEGRITGFTMGTGQTLSLLPPQNATGNFVKIVQRLPVRIELTDYDPNNAPLFVGLSVEPYVYTKEPPTGPNAGAVLQPVAAPPVGSPESRR